MLTKVRYFSFILNSDLIYLRIVRVEILQSERNCFSSQTVSFLPSFRACVLMVADHGSSSRCTPRPFSYGITVWEPSLIDSKSMMGQCEGLTSTKPSRCSFRVGTTTRSRSGRIRRGDAYSRSMATWTTSERFFFIMIYHGFFRARMTKLLEYGTGKIGH